MLLLPVLTDLDEEEPLPTELFTEVLILLPEDEDV
jgi:hypothetical protein